MVAYALSWGGQILVRHSRTPKLLGWPLTPGPHPTWPYWNSSTFPHQRVPQDGWYPWEGKTLLMQLSLTSATTPYCPILPWENIFNSSTIAFAEVLNSENNLHSWWTGEVGSCKIFHIVLVSNCLVGHVSPAIISSGVKILHVVLATPGVRYYWVTALLECTFWSHGVLYGGCKMQPNILCSWSPPQVGGRNSFGGGSATNISLLCLDSSTQVQSDLHQQHSWHRCEQPQQNSEGSPQGKELDVLLSQGGLHCSKFLHKMQHMSCINVRRVAQDWAACESNFL